MTWIHQLSKANIPFNVYKLNPEDSLVCSQIFNLDQILIIIHGIIHVTHIYNNKEIIPLTILFQGHTLSVTHKLYQIQSYYKYTSINTTYIISFSKTSLHKIKNKVYIYVDILNTYNLTIQQYTIMKHIFIEKEMKYRLLKFIIFLCNKFGIIKHTYIYLPFSIKQKILAKILGSNTVTINRIIKELSQELLIRYTYKKKIYITNIYIFRYYSYLLK
uniref:Global nitrogen transcriptional regulator n=1 Tax=Callithamnion tetricum TaxID=193179 RepID=A0A4D6WQY8_9FLOR|nr:global nitrogen transcriptional regulator [Callithamnion tetricum]